MANFDFDIFFAIQNIGNPFLDKFFATIISIAGIYGQIWSALGIELLVKRPSNHSCPLIHSEWASAAAISNFLYNKRIGIPVIIFSNFIAFNRLYLFVHFPSDVLFGKVLE